MKLRQVKRIVGWFGVAVLAGVSAACSAAGPAGEVPAEKVATTGEALIQQDPTGPYAYPEPVLVNIDQPHTCERKLRLTGGGSTGILASVDGENYLALPVRDDYDNAGNLDPYATQFTHGYRYNATNCAAGDVSCTLESDFFGIPSAHGFKYNVKRITSISCQVDSGGRQTCAATTTADNWYVEGLQRVDESWWTRPWSYEVCTGNVCSPVYQQCGGKNCPPPWTILDANSHPSYGTDFKSADWLSLWNLAYTYSYVDPSSPSLPPNEPYTSHIESEHHQCAAIFIDPANLQLIDFLVAIEKHDPGGTNW